MLFRFDLLSQEMQYVQQFEVSFGLALPGSFGVADCSLFPAVALHLPARFRGQERETTESGFWKGAALVIGELSVETKDAKLSG